MIDQPLNDRSRSERVLARARRMMRSEILTGRADPDGLLALTRIIFPGEDVSDPKFLTWLYDRNPGGRAVEFLTRNQGLVTGHIAFLPLRYKIGNGTAVGSVVVNAITHPDYRGRGIFMILHDLAAKAALAERVAFSFGFANLSSEKGCLRHLGYRKLANLPLWVLPFNLPRILASQPSKRSKAWRSAAWAAQPPLNLWRWARRPRKGPSADIRKIAEFGPEFDELWASASKNLNNALIRDRAFLNWRFVEAPTRRYNLWAAFDGSRPVGCLAGRSMEIEGLRWGFIVDLFSEDSPDGRAAASWLVAAFHAHLAGEGTDIAASLMPAHAPAARALRRNGYVVCPPSLLPRDFPVLLRWNMPEPPPPRFFETSNWFMTLADFDAL
jgi:GNAT superfamily N-acetyltransferase